MKHITKTNLFEELFLLSLIIMISCSNQTGGNMSINLLNQADNHFKNRQIEQALSLYKETTAAAEKEKNNSVLVEAYSQIARCYLSQNNIGEGKSWLTKAGKLASYEDPKGWSRYLSVKGRFEWKEAAIEKKEISPVVEKASATFKEMYEYCFTNSLHERAVDATNMVSITGNSDERIDWGLKGIEAAEQGNLESWLGPLWNNLGWNYDETGDHDNALNALLKAREFHYKGEKNLPKLIADWSVGHAYRKTGQLDSALAWMTKVYEWSVKRHNKNPSPENAEWVGFSNKELGEIDLINNDIESAYEHFTKARENLQVAGMPEWDSKGYQEIVEKIEELRVKLKK